MTWQALPLAYLPACLMLFAQAAPAIPASSAAVLFFLTPVSAFLQQYLSSFHVYAFVLSSICYVHRNRFPSALRLIDHKIHALQLSRDS
jgi:hypothetical protein